MLFGPPDLSQHAQQQLFLLGCEETERKLDDTEEKNVTSFPILRNSPKEDLPPFPLTGNEDF